MSPMNIYDIIRSGIFRERIKHICTYFSRPKHKMYQPSLKETVTIWANDYGRQKKKPSLSTTSGSLLFLGFFWRVPDRMRFLTVGMQANVAVLINAGPGIHLFLIIMLN